MPRLVWSSGGRGKRLNLDVLAQALNVAELADAASGSATLTFDLHNASHRAAYAAALAVLRISGVDEEDLLRQTGLDVPGARVSALSTPEPKLISGVDDLAPDALPEIEGDPALIEALRRGYLEAMTDLTQDEERRETVTRDTFPRVVELLRDGANVEAVAQIQYRRWVEEHLDAVR